MIATFYFLKDFKYKVNSITKDKVEIEDLTSKKHIHQAVQINK